MSPEEADAMSEVVGRPLPSYESSNDPVAEMEGAMFAPGGPPLPIFINGDGGRYVCGNSNDSSVNRSTIACHSSPADVGGWPGTDAQFDELVVCLQDMFARFNVVVTDVEPAAPPYVEAVVGGGPWDIGLGSGVAGISPFICGVIEKSIVFTFAEVYNENSSRFVQSVCETTAQEIAHSFGLEHEMNCADPMTYLSACGYRTFQDEWSNCGEYSPRQCSCGGSQQNSVRQLYDELGPRTDDLQPPSAALVMPASGAVLQAHSEIVVEAEVQDDVGATVTLEWDYSGEAWACPGSDGAWSCVRDGTRHTWTINVGEGARTFRVRAVDFGGHDVVTEDRSIWLSNDGSPPPQDSGPPMIRLATPLAGAVLDSDETLRIVASIVDDNAITRVDMDWPYTAKVFKCPMSDATVTCTVDGSTYTWEINVGEGDRPFTIRATDLVGNRSTWGPTTITLVAGAPTPADDAREDDDTHASARAVACGDTHALIADDADWLSLTVPADNIATITTTPAFPLEARTPALALIASGAGVLALAEPGSVLIEVRPPTAASGPYLLEVDCEAPPAPPAQPPSDSEDDPERDPEAEDPGIELENPDVPAPIVKAGTTCGATGTPLLFALLAAVRRRRGSTIG